MTNKELADQIRERFMPAAFRCGCGGMDASCKMILEENIGGAWQVKDVVDRVAAFIEREGK